MGRNAKPIGLQLAEGNPNNLTKEEIQARKDDEIKLGKSAISKLKPPPFVRNDAVAFKYWKQHLKEYQSASDQGVELLTSSDIGMLALYCKTYAEYERLLVSYQSIDNIVLDSEKLSEYVENSEDFDTKVKQQLRSMLSVDAILRIETAINKKMDMLLKMQDRLFLNPLAKIKFVPKKKREDKPKSKFGKFGAN